MGAEAMPMEILLLILKNLKGTDAVACRAVCRRWRDAVDYLTDNVWEDYCYRDFSNPKIAKDVSNLSYRDLYRSLTLWSKVEEAQEKCTTKPVKNVHWFKVLNNNMLAILPQFGNSIEYYNIETMTLISCRTFNFDIVFWEENEYLIALLEADNNDISNIHVIIKSNDREIVVGKQIEIDNFTLLNTELYFMSEEDMMCVARLKVVDEEETVETVELHDLDDYVVAFARAGDDGVNVLTQTGNIYSYCYGTKELTLRVQFEENNVTDLYDALRHFGFQWSEAFIYHWLSDTYPEKELQITKPNHGKIHTHNHVVLVGTAEGSVHVYKRSYYENGELKTYTSNPDKIIDVNKYSEVDHFIIDKVDVVETLKGHRLLILSSNFQLFCVDLLHEQVNMTPEAQITPPLNGMVCNVA